jgi:hypothetical protein
LRRTFGEERKFVAQKRIFFVLINAHRRADDNIGRDWVGEASPANVVILSPVARLLEELLERAEILEKWTCL